MIEFYICLASALLAGIHVWFLRHSLAETRGQLFVWFIVGCIPFVNVVLLLCYYYVAVMEGWGLGKWLNSFFSKPLKVKR